MPDPSTSPSRGTEREPFRTSIVFGAGETIDVTLTLGETRKLVEKALRKRVLVELEDPSGEVLVINPQQVKVLRRLDGRVAER